MCCMGFIKRFAPFAIALSLGLFITSLFVDISLPKFKRGHHKHKRHQYVQELERKNAELERQNAELRSQLGMQPAIEMSEVPVLVPDAPVPPPPIAPLAPHAHR